MTSGTPPPWRIRSLGEPGDLGWVVQAHGELYAREFGWDVTFEALVARIVADYAAEPDPERAAAWIAQFPDGRRVGCVFCVDAGGGRAKLRTLLVHPDARGQGLGAALVDTCIRFATDAGYGELELWTNDVLGSARRIYLAAGFVLAEQRPHRSFGADLVGQTWRRPLGTLERA